MSNGAHLRFTGGSNGAFSLEIDGVDFSKVALARDFSITIEDHGGRPRAVAHVAIDAVHVDVDIRDVIARVAESAHAAIEEGGA